MGASWAGGEKLAFLSLADAKETIEIVGEREADHDEDATEDDPLGGKDLGHFHQNEAMLEMVHFRRQQHDPGESADRGCEGIGWISPGDFVGFDVVLPGPSFSRPVDGDRGKSEHCEFEERFHDLPHMV